MTEKAADDTMPASDLGDLFLQGRIHLEWILPCALWDPFLFVDICVRSRRSILTPISVGDRSLRLISDVDLRAELRDRFLRQTRRSIPALIF